MGDRGKNKEGDSEEKPLITWGSKAATKVSERKRQEKPRIRQLFG
jgi:hypothetical protein